jgi:hypothetical protein
LVADSHFDGIPANEAERIRLAAREAALQAPPISDALRDEIAQMLGFVVVEGMPANAA